MLTVSSLPCFSNPFNLFLVSVLPDRPQNLSIVNVTTNSIYLNWSLPEDMTPLQIVFQHRLLYQCVNGPKEWKVCCNTKII